MKKKKQQEQTTELAFARDRDTGQLYARVTRGIQRFHKVITIYEIEVMAVNFELSANQAAARLCRTFINLVASTPVGKALPKSEFYDSECETVHEWLNEPPRSFYRRMRLSIQGS